MHIFFFFLEKQTHTERREKGVLTQGTLLNIYIYIYIYISLGSILCAFLSSLQFNIQDR